MPADRHARRARLARAALIAAALAGAAGRARAQPVAVAPPPERPLPLHPHAGLGGTIAFGLAHQADRPDAWLVRLDYEVLPALGLPGRFGAVFGFGPGLQLWRGGGDWGFGLPLAVLMGVRAPVVRATLGFGFETFLVDKVAGDTGFGLFAPMACASAGLDVRGWRAGLDGRVTRRWQFGAPDHTQWQATVFVGRTWESTLDEPIR